MEIRAPGISSVAQNQTNNDIFDALNDGYASKQTFQENKAAQSEINQTILQALDGYATGVGGGVSEQTFQENKAAQAEINQIILQALDGYSASGSGGVSEQTFQENKAAQAEINQTILTALDGYATGVGGGVSETTFQENKTAQQQINQTILQSLDGYATLILALDLTETQHTQQQNQINQSLIQSLDGYVLNQTFEENKNTQGDINNFILQSLDGYASKATEAEHYSQLSQAVQDIVSTIDGYSTDIEFSGLNNTFQENKNAQQQINQTIIQALDGYATLIAGVDLTEIQHTQYQDQFNQTITQALDGYQTQLNSTVSEITFQENKTAQQQINQTILQALDGYATGVGGGVSEQTFQENKTAQQQINQTILQALDGYSASGAGAVSEQTFQENKAAQAEINQTILTALDGYTTAVSSGVAEGTFQENKDFWNEAIYQLRVAADGYATLISGLDTTETQHTQQQNQVNQTILQALDGYALSVDHVSLVSDVARISTNVSAISTRLDAVSNAASNALSVGNAVSAAHASLVSDVGRVSTNVSAISTRLDAVSSLITGVDLTETQHTQQQNQVNQTIIQALDGYATLIAGVDLTETQHTQYQNQVNQTILQALDGYALSVDHVSLVSDVGRISTNVSAISTRLDTVSAAHASLVSDVGRISLNASAISTRLDTVSNAASNATSIANAVSAAHASLVSDVGRISTSTSAMETTFQDNKNFWNEAIYQLRVAADGYATLISGVDLTETQHTQYQNQVNQTILQALDGYALSADHVSLVSDVGRISLNVSAISTAHVSLVSDVGRISTNVSAISTRLDTVSSLITGVDLTETQHTQQQNQVNQTILQTLDGYALSVDHVSLVSDVGRISTNVSAISTRLDTVSNAASNALSVANAVSAAHVSLVSDVGRISTNVSAISTRLDTVSSLITGVDLTETQHTQQQNQVNQTILQTLDGYLTTNTAVVGDGYVAFFTGTGTNIAGDNDLFYDRVNGRLGINTTTPFGRLHVASEAPTNLPTSFTNDDFVVGKGDGTGGIFFRFDTSQSAGVMGAFDNGGTWHTLFIGAHHTVFMDSSGGSTISFDGTNGLNALRLRSAGSLVWSQSTDAADTPDTGLSKISAGVVAVGNGTQGDASGTLQVANINVSGNINNATLSETIQVIRQALDGYTTAVSSGVSEQTFQENKAAQGEINQTILTALDGYAGGGGVSETTFQENKSAQQQINQTILQALDGYQVNIDAVSAAHVSLVSDVGRISTNVSAISTRLDTVSSLITGVDLTETQHTQYQNQVNQTILQALDGYALSADHVSLVSDVGRISTNISAMETTFQNNKSYWNDAISYLRVAADGYATLISGLDTTEIQHKQYQDQVNQTILQALDGYALSIDHVSLVSDVGRISTNVSAISTRLDTVSNAASNATSIANAVSAAHVSLVSDVGRISLNVSAIDQAFQNNKTAQAEINQTILTTLDGYAGGGGVSETTFQENKSAQQQINQTILQALDAYAPSSTDVIVDVEHFQAESLDDADPNWPNTATAPITNSVNTPSVLTRSFSDGYEAAAGGKFHVPTDATSMRFDWTYQASSAPGTTNNKVQWRLDYRTLGTTGLMSNYSFTVQTNANDTNFAIFSETVSIATLGLTAGGIYQFQLVRLVVGISNNMATPALLSEFQTTWTKTIVVSGGGSGGVNEITFQENKNFWNEAIYQLRVAADGYGGAGGVSEQTFQENKNAQYQVNQTILQALDGYALSVDHVSLVSDVGRISLNVSAMSTKLDTVSNQISVALSQISVISAGLGGVQMRWVSTADSITGSAVTNISGLSISVAAGGTYQLVAQIMFNLSSLTAFGFGLSYPSMAAAAFKWELNVSAPVASSLSTTGYLKGYVMESANNANTGVVHISSPAPGTSQGFTYIATLNGQVNVSAAGTLQVVVKQAAAAVVVLKGSFIRAFKIV